MSATDLRTDSVLAPTDPGLATADPGLVPADPGLATALAYAPDEFVDDDSWAKPRPRENKRLVGIACAMAVLLVGLGMFTLGAKLGKDSTKTSTGVGARSGLAAAFGAGGGLGGFGGGAGGFGGGRAARNGGTGTAAGGTGTGAAAGASQAEIRAGLLAGGSTGATSGAGAAAAPAAQGTVTKIDATSITVTKADGTIVVITIDNKAEIARRTKAALADVKVGDKVAATGSTDSVGNVAAAIVTVGELEPVDASASATTTDTTPTPNTSGDLGGLLGG